MYSGYTYSYSGDSTVIVKLGNDISPEINKKVRAFSAGIKEKSIQGVVEIVPSYNCISVIYDPSVISLKKLVSMLRKIEKNDLTLSAEKTQTVHIPTVYGGDYGPDLGYVCAYNSLTPEDVVRIHSEQKYLIYMMGFTPGFPYLGGVNESIATPRKEIPRERIPAGSVGIAGNQTGIYPLVTPGGWQIIGKTPLKLFDAGKENPFLLKPGQYLKFEHISESEYLKIEKEIEQGIYEPLITISEGEV